MSTTTASTSTSASATATTAPSTTVPVTAASPATSTTAYTTASVTTASPAVTLPSAPTGPQGWEHFANDLRRELQSMRQRQLIDAAQIATLTGENMAMKQALGVAPDVSNFTAPTFSHGYVPIYSTTTTSAPAQPPISTQPPFDPYGTYTYSVLGGRPFTASLGGGNGGGSGGGGPPGGPGGPGDPRSPLYNPNVPPPMNMTQFMGKFKAPDLNMTFSGEGDPDTVSTAAKAFYYRIEDHIEIHKWDVAYAARMAYSNFKGKALSWITTERDSGETYLYDWTLLRKEFLDRFYTPLSMAEKANRLKSLSQKREEKSADYFDRVKNITELLYGQDPTRPRETNPALKEANRAMKDQIIMTHFVGGLRQAVREVVANGDHKTLKEVREAAIRAENAATNPHTGNAKEILENSTVEDKDVNATSKKPFNPKGGAGGGGGRKFDGNCAYCSKYGHRCRDCFVMKEDKKKGIFKPKDPEFFERMKRLRQTRDANVVDQENKDNGKNDDEEKAADAVAAYYNFHNPLNF